MAAKETLLSIILGFGITSCNIDRAAYTFNEKIGNEHVNFSKEDFVFNDCNTLTITKPDGRKIVYFDNNNDLGVDYYDITINGKTERKHMDYHDDVLSKVSVEAQRNFNSYMGKIRQIKINRELKKFN